MESSSPSSSSPSPSPTDIETIASPSNKEKETEKIEYLYGEHTCMTYEEHQKYTFELNSLPIRNVFLINTFEEVEPNVLELEILFNKYDLNVHGIMKKKDATRDNIMNSVEEFREIIQNNEPTLLVYFGQGYTKFLSRDSYLVTSDNYIIHVDEIIQEFNYPKLCVSPILFIKFFYANFEISFKEIDQHKSCFKTVLDDEDDDDDDDDDNRNDSTLQSLCLKTIYKEKKQLLTHCERNLPRILINTIKEYIKRKNWDYRKLKIKCFDVDIFSIQDVLTLTQALTDIATDKPLPISVIKQKFFKNITEINCKHGWIIYEGIIYEKF